MLILKMSSNQNSVANNAQSLLQEKFGYSQFRPLQEDIIDHAMEEKDSLVIMPTGGGKSICFQLPALLLNGSCLVVSPLISLMRDQVDALKQNGIEAECLNSMLTKEEQAAIEEDLSLER